MTLDIDLFWSFRSPYSYLATPRLVEMAHDYDLNIHVRPVYPLAVRSGEFFGQVNPMWIPYLMRDTYRLSQMLDMPYRWPRPDPVVVDPSTRAATPNQPYIHRLTRLGCAAADAGHGLDFLDQVSRVIWSGDTPNWHEGDHLAMATERAGLHLAALDREDHSCSPEKYEAVIQANQKAHQDSGHWGVPTMVFEGEPFFGQDRLDVLLWRLKQNVASIRGKPEPLKRAALFSAAIVAVLIAAGWIATRFISVDLWLYRHVATRMAGRPAQVLAKPGELSVLLCGTNAPLPDLHRAGACTLIAAGDDLYVVDAGAGSVRNLVMWRVPLAKVKGVFLTHFHSDHIEELGELRLQTWVAGRRSPLKVYGPPGVEDVVAGFNKAYSHDADYRTAHHGEKMLPREDVDLTAVAIPMSGATAPALDASGLKVTAIRVDHGPVKPAYGYRFDYAGRSVTISGDTKPYLPLRGRRARQRRAGPRGAIECAGRHSGGGADEGEHVRVRPRSCTTFRPITRRRCKPRRSPIRRRRSCWCSRISTRRCRLASPNAPFSVAFRMCGQMAGSSVATER